GEYPEARPVRHYILTNGTETRVYHADRTSPLFVVPFTGFEDGTAKFDELRGLLGRGAIVSISAEGGMLSRMERPTIADINATFAWCHQHVYKKDNISQSDAFSEFVKLIALKLLSDRRIRDSYPEVLELDQFEVPVNGVQFSESWIQQNEASTPNPISD